MPINSFNEISSFTTAMAFIAGMWGAGLNFIQRKQYQEVSIRKKILMFIVDMFTSMGFTMLSFVGLVGYGLNELLAVAISGFIGHLGARSTYLVEMLIAEKIGAKETFKTINQDRNRDELL